MAQSEPKSELAQSLEHAAALSRAGRVRRVVYAAVIAAAAIFWTDWPIALGLFVAIVLWDLGVGGRLDAVWPVLIARGRPDLGFLLFNGAVFIGACLYCALPAIGWLSGNPIGQHFAVIYCCATITVGFIYFYSSRLQLLAAIGPVTVLAIAAPLTIYGFTAQGLLMALCIAVMISCAHTAAQDWRMVLANLSEQSRARAAAEAANNAKSQFLATMSHELRTPLNAVIGYAEIMRDDIEDGATPKRADADRIIGAGHHLLALINEVLDSARLESNKLELHETHIDFAALLHGVGQMLQPMADKNANRLEIVGADAPIWVTLDAQRVTQCLLNLGSNACKFTHDGVVRFTASCDRDGDHAIITISVRDTGCGIAPEDAARLFQPFQQVQSDLARQHNGAGLGLAITRKLARMMGGDVTLTSAPGVGSEFTLRVRAKTQAVALAA